MSDVVEVLHDFLMHYASQYYDPVKAHEYYERTKKLKGRTTSGMTEDQKETWTYVKDQVTSEKTQKIKDQGDVKIQQIEELRSNAAQARERISARLKQLNDLITKKATAKRETLSEKQKREIEALSEKQKREIDSLPAIPKGVSQEQRARLQVERSEAIAEIRGERSEAADKVRGEGKVARSTITENAQEGRESNRVQFREYRQRVASKLKTAIKGARDAYDAAKKALVDKYEGILDSEYQKITGEQVTKRTKRGGGK